MPKVHKLGTKRFVQLITQPLEWGNKRTVKGWTQEIEPPYRYSSPTLVKLFRNKILVIGTWEGTKSEEDALNSALERRNVTYDDFTEEAGWIPAPDEDSETDFETTNS
jgi:hypothetical protein